MTSKTEWINLYVRSFHLTIDEVRQLASEVAQVKGKGPLLKRLLEELTK